jgi:hypothetical protein
LINANEIGLVVSEIEGDAILFYKFGDAPELKDLYRQVEKMFCDFHIHLIAYDIRRFCQCTACSSAIHLTLKVITHYGEFADYHVKSFKKLIGKDIIVAHQLLKNDIEQHEYWLVTESLVPDKPPAELAAWMQWNTSAKKIDSGEITFHYAQLGQLRNDITPAIPEQLDLSNKAKMISVSKEYETDIITLFHATGDFNYKSRWQEGVEKVEKLDHFLPRVGMRCRCVQDDGQVTILSSSYSYSQDRIEFSETDESNKQLTYIMLEKTGPKKTKLTLDFYVQASVAGQLLFTIIKKKKIEDRIKKSLLNLVELVKEIKLPMQA